MAARAIMSNDMTRSWVLDIARRWIGTPYCHQASSFQAGCDCLGLIRGVWRELYGEEPQVVPSYSMRWDNQAGGEPLLAAANSHFLTVRKDQAQPGDMALFRMRPDLPCRHIAILSGQDTMIHAYWGRSVRESHLVPYWSRRWAYAFSFPSIEIVS